MNTEKHMVGYAMLSKNKDGIVTSSRYDGEEETFLIFTKKKMAIQKSKECKSVGINQQVMKVKITHYE